MQGDPSHTYITSYSNTAGVDEEFDVWRTTDADGRVLQWATLHGDDSRSIIAGSLSVISTPPPSNSPAPVTSPALTPTRGDPSHSYVGTDSSGDVWDTRDSAGNVLRWSVKPGDDSRNVIAGTLRTISTSSNYANSLPSTPVTVGANQTGLGAATSAPPPAPATNAPPNYVTPGNTTPAAVAPSLYGSSNASRIQGNPQHKYVGSDSKYDYWQITDSDGSVVQWAVLINHDSREIVDGTIKRIGGTAVAPVTQPSTSTAGTGGGGVNGTVGGTNSNGVGTVPFVHPVSKASGNIPASWRRAGTMPNGDPIFSLLDADGATKTFALDTQFQAYWTNGVSSGGLSGAPTASLPVATAATDGKAALFVGLGVVALKAFILS